MKASVGYRMAMNQDSVVAFAREQNQMQELRDMLDGGWEQEWALVGFVRHDPNDREEVVPRRKCRQGSA